jgi:hypothetical protein
MFPATPQIIDYRIFFFSVHTRYCQQMISSSQLFTLVYFIAKKIMVSHFVTKFNTIPEMLVYTHARTHAHTRTHTPCKNHLLTHIV